MALFPSGQSPDINTELQNLRMQGLTGDQIVSELKAKGFHEAQIMAAVNQLDGQGGAPPMDDMGMDQNDAPPMGAYPSAAPPMQHQGGMGSNQQGNLYDRVEEIAEGLIDEKWDELIAEVKKVIAWKEKVEEQNHKLRADVDKLREDFKTLHQAVLGKVEEYDKRMQDVGTELKAVGKVFKEVVPVFTDNVKELRDITSTIKNK